MLMTKKRHEREMAELTRRHETNHSTSVAALRSRHAEDLKLFGKFMERVKLYRIRHGMPTTADGESHTYSVTTEISVEMMHSGLGGSKRMAAMVANEIRGDIELALVALCHLDQPPVTYRRPPYLGY